jgi:subtilisin family serine protease
MDTARLAGLLSLFAFVAHASFASTETNSSRILIKPKSAASAPALGRFHQAHSATVLQTFPGLGGLQILSLAANQDSRVVVTEYQKSGLVDFAESDQVGEVFATPNDPKYLDGTLWALNNTGQSGGLNDADIDAPEGWDLMNSASNIIVAVLDTGVRYTHEDLAANMWTSTSDGSHGWNTIEQNNDPSDGQVHGTMVAGVLGAVGNNGKGVTGVAWKVQMIACKCFNTNGSGLVSDVIICMDYAKTNGAKIINASFGFGDSAALSNAVLALQDAGVIVVAACGNSSTNVDVTPTFPACYHFDNVVSVAYTTRNDTLAGPSNFGVTNVHLAAPGENITSTFPATDSFYFSNSGTSFAAPYVSGALALVLAHFPAESYQLAIARILSGVDPLPSLAGKCSTGGRLNLRYALNPPIRLRALSAAPNGLTVRVIAGPNRNCTVETSSDFVAWSPLVTNTTSPTGFFDFLDGPSGNTSRKFYRAVAAP